MELCLGECMMEATINFGYPVAMAVPMLLSLNLFWKRRKDERSLSSNILPTGWQFYDKPTTLEGPGTVFRIDRDKKKALVHELKVKTMKGEEAFGRVETSIEANAGIVASFLGLRNLSLGANAGKIEAVKMEMQNLVREVATDHVLDPVLKPYLKEMAYRVKNRYYIIREATTTDEIYFQLTKSQVISLGGEVSLEKAFSVKGHLFRKKNEVYVLQQKFEKPMRIMFLPEEIKPISAGLGGDGPELGLVPVKGVLDWNRTS
jgi:hypothetical protein